MRILTDELMAHRPGVRSAGREHDAALTGAVRITPPGPGEVRVWLADLDPGAAVVDRLVALLSADERERAARFHFRRDAMRWIVARATLREILGGVPRDWIRARSSFTYGHEGQAGPRRADRGARSAVQRRALGASGGVRGDGRRSGRRRRGAAARGRPRWRRIAERTFSRRECAALRGLPAELRPTGFFNCWTRKEAYIKALGAGAVVSARSLLGVARSRRAGAARVRRRRPRPRGELDDGCARAALAGFVGRGRGRARGRLDVVCERWGEPAMTAAELVAHLRALDVRLSVDGDRLRCSAPKGVLTDELRDQLSTRKAEILEWLREHGEGDGADAPADREPASFAQQRLWFMDQLSPGGFAYNITGGLRILGPLERRGARAELWASWFGATSRSAPCSRRSTGSRCRSCGRPAATSTCRSWICRRCRRRTARRRDDG